MAQRLLQVDLFADQAGMGLPCLVVLSGAGPGAGPNSLVPTATIVEPQDPVSTARLVTTGDPLAATMAAALAVAQDRAPDLIRSNDLRLVLEVGDERHSCDLRQTQQGAVWVSLHLGAVRGTLEAAAAPADLRLQEIGFDDHHSAIVNVAGQAVLLLPMASQVALQQASFATCEGPVLAYTHEVTDATHALHVRAKACDWGTALRALALAVLTFDRPRNGLHTLTLGVTFANARTGHLMLDLQVDQGHLADVVVHACGWLHDG